MTKMKHIKRLEVETICGDDIEKVFLRVKDCSITYGYATFAKFNGNEINSYDSIDNAYLRITGVNRAEHKARQEAFLKKMEDDDVKHELKIPALTKEFIEKADGIIIAETMDAWKECVSVRLRGLYKGEELQAMLDIAVLINDGKFDEADELFRSHGHSGASHDLVRSMLESFIQDGELFTKKYYYEESD